MKKLLLLLPFIFSSSHIFSQIKKITPFTNLTVIQNGQPLKNPLAGGISIPQYSTMDLNNDGKKDLVVFNKDGNRISCFLNEGTSGTIKYTYAPQYNSKFPADIYDWMMLRDYNGDGKEDIFTQVNLGIRVFKNTSTGNDLSFALVCPIIEADYGTGFPSNLDVNTIELPEIIDIDNDGDLDIFKLTALSGVGGDEVYFYKNLAVELTGSAESFAHYAIYKRCWGRFKEDYFGCTVELNSQVEECGKGERNENPADTKLQNNLYRSNRDAGSSSLIFDANGDGKYDFLGTDVSCRSLYLVINTGDNTDALMTSVQYNYPPSYPVNITNFPAPFFIDVNNDGMRDLLVATTFKSSNYNNTWLYLNTGTDASPVFTMHTKTFLQDQMIDVKQNASPHFFDYDQDGDKDMAIANSGSWTNDPLSASRDSATISLYKNIGSDASPVFSLVSPDYNEISQYNFISLAMGTADVDRDGDEDLMLGEEDGTLYYFQNTAAPHTPANFQLHTPFYQNIDVSKYSIPYFVNINNDDRPDLILGGKSPYRDSLILFTDTSTGTLPGYKLINNRIGGIKQSIPFTTGASVYFNKDYDGNGTNALFVAKGNLIYFYDHVPSDLSGTFQKTDSFRVDAGLFLRITMHDLNGDGKKELIAGTAAGGILAYEIEYMNTGMEVNKAPDRLFSVYPNPSSDHIQVLSKDPKQIIHKVEVYDILGKKIFAQNNINGISTRIPVTDFDSGNYILRIYSAETIAVQRIQVY